MKILLATLICIFQGSSGVGVDGPNPYDCNANPDDISLPAGFFVDCPPCPLGALSYVSLDCVDKVTDAWKTGKADIQMQACDAWNEADANWDGWQDVAELNWSICVNSCNNDPLCVAEMMCNETLQDFYDQINDARQAEADQINNSYDSACSQMEDELNDKIKDCCHCGHIHDPYYVHIGNNVWVFHKPIEESFMVVIQYQNYTSIDFALAGSDTYTLTLPQEFRLEDATITHVPVPKPIDPQKGEGPPKVGDSPLEVF